MTEREALKLALEALEKHAELGLFAGATITAIKAALEAKDEKANDELRRLHDLLGKANALARIRANKIDELEQRLTKTEAQLGEAVWNYGELKREQLANQQKTSGSPINTSTALEAKDEPVAWWIPKHKAPDMVSKVRWSDECEPLYATPPQRTWVGLTDGEVDKMILLMGFPPDWITENAIVKNIVRNLEAKLKEKNT